MALIIFGITVLMMMLSLVFFPKVKIKNVQIKLYWVITLIGSGLMYLLVISDKKKVFLDIFTGTKMNPVKLIIIFMSVTCLSIFLDNAGFFRYLSSIMLKKVQGSQKKFFMYLFILISFLTIFTSNDVMILTFTPFIIYFSKNAKINPLPYLISLLITANTFSMMLQIGNPTNIYLSTMADISFMSYFKVMWLPALVAGFTGFVLVYLIFRRELSKKMEMHSLDFVIKNRIVMLIGLFHLASCIIFMALSNIIDIDMWIVGMSLVVSLILLYSIYCCITKTKDIVMLKSIKELPYNFIPMIISMFVLMYGLNESGATLRFANYLNQFPHILSYGFSSHVVANIMNNQPMSMLYSEMIILSEAPISAVYASVIGSNTAVLMTPLGALAGLMWFELLKNQGYEISYKTYFKYMIPIGFIVLTFSLLALMTMI